jgi:hypothetical protein
MLEIAPPFEQLLACVGLPPTVLVATITACPSNWLSTRTAAPPNPARNRK